MAERRPTTVFILLNLAWLAIVLAGIAIVIWKFDEYGIGGVIAIGIGLAMLVIFGISHLSKSAHDKPMTKRLGEGATGALILGAILVLAYSLVRGYRNFGVFGTAVLLLFLVIFVGILKDYIKHLRNPKKGSRAKRTIDNAEGGDGES